MSELRIEITADDVRRGIQGDAESCPVALAARRAFNCDEHDITIDGENLDYDGPDQIFWPFDGADLPEEVRQAIDEFDRTGRMTPFAFTITEIE